jgi:hypothetical protein
MRMSFLNMKNKKDMNVSWRKDYPSGKKKKENFS